MGHQPAIAAPPSARRTAQRQVHLSATPVFRGTIGRETDVPQNANYPFAEPLPGLFADVTYYRHAAPVTGNLVLQLGMKQKKMPRLVNPSESSRNGRWPPLLFVSL